MTSASQRRRLLELLEPVVSGAGYDLESLAVTTAGRRRLLRLVVDRDGGVDLDAVADLSHAASAALDDSDLMDAAAYVLEVTSPGVDRPLTEPRHWRRATGRLVSVTLRDGRDVTGRIVDVTDDGVTLDVGGEQVHHPFAALGRGRVQVEFGRPGGEAS